MWSKQTEAHVILIELSDIRFINCLCCCVCPQYPYETLFRSQHYALLDNGCREYLFLSDFFMVAGNSALDLFNSIMGKTLSMFLVRKQCVFLWALQPDINTPYDSLQCCYCVCSVSTEEHVHVRVRLLRQHRHLPVHPHHPPVQSHHRQEDDPRPRQVSDPAAERKRIYSCHPPPLTVCVCVCVCVCVVCARRYWEAVLELLWPRFEMILEMNIHSIRNTDPQKLGLLDTRPHYVSLHTHTHTCAHTHTLHVFYSTEINVCVCWFQITRRYAEFSSAIVSINQTFPNERTHTLLGQLQVTHTHTHTHTDETTSCWICNKT